MAKRSGFDDFVPLDRTFRALVQGEETTDDTDLSILRGESRLRWADLLESPRVVLLSEAGSGKTVETRNACLRLRSQGRAAFFVRIEHVVESFEEAFEEGSFEEFNEWIASGGEGWLLLDSVDEARLKDPRDFERAVRILGRQLAPVMARAHILITGRTVAWRPKTDLLLIKQHFPYSPPSSADLDLTNEEGGAEKETEAADGFRLVALDDLHGDQVDQFAAARGVGDLAAFRLALDRKDVWTLTSRPLDLAEICEYWVKHGRIGSRLELMKSSIDRRLEEIDQNRADARPISVKDLRRGAKLVAAAATLTHQSSLRVPDGSSNHNGLPVQQILADWDDSDIGTLLSRPIFDEGIYGTVRFHHRSVRELLTAEWLAEQIVGKASRVKIEALFFKEQYGLEVIVPTTRPVLPWLCLFDQRILDRTIRLAPEVLFEGGDPSQLPSATRSAILRQTCEQLAQPAHGRSMLEFAAVQRFANEDLNAEIRDLLERYSDQEEIVAFLMRMVWLGELRELRSEAMHFAVKLQEEYTRLTAIRAVISVGDPDDIRHIRWSMISEGIRYRAWPTELIETLPVDDESSDWLLEVVEVAPGRRRFDVDPLADALPAYVGRLPNRQLRRWAVRLQQLLATPPLAEPGYRNVSKRFAWLSGIAALCALRLIEARDLAALEPPVLWILRDAREFDDDYVGTLRNARQRISETVQLWPELNRALFWYDVTETRAHRSELGKATLDVRDVGIFGHDWVFGPRDFEAICREIASRVVHDDRVIALTLAFEVYRTSGRPRDWRGQMWRAVRGDEALEQTLRDRLHPKPHPDAKKWRRQRRRFQSRQSARIAKEKHSRERAVEILKTRVDTIRDFGRDDVISQDQWYLYGRLREERDRLHRWSVSDWRKLEPEFGAEVAAAFRDGAMGFWRRYSPEMLSDGGESNSTSAMVIFGLTGLNIEAAEVPDWTANLSSAEALKAAKYGLRELNGFSAWFPELYAAFPEEVEAAILTEIDFELATNAPDGDSHYALHDVAWHGSFLSDRFASAILERLGPARPNAANLAYLLLIVNRSSLPDSAIREIAARKAKTIRHDQLSPMWFATWCGVDPEAAIPALTIRLASLNKPELQTQFAMRFLTDLVRGRRISKGFARQAYRQVRYLRDLLLLMHQYIRQTDDIDRAGKGVFSPGLRDDAQDARNALHSFIAETPGKEAFLALMDISKGHPDAGSRPWAAYRAKSKAALDADFAPWTAKQVREFAVDLERTPSNHHELWDLAVDRLNDLKNDLEGGDTSIAPVLALATKEVLVRNFIGGWCRDRAAGRYTIPQEEELSDAKRPDLRFQGAGFDAPVPVELKLTGGAWTGPKLFERLENQLCGDYLRDDRSRRGILLLVHNSPRGTWDHPLGGRIKSFDALLEALRHHWKTLSARMDHVDDVAIIGIDLMKRARTPSMLPRS